MAHIRRQFHDLVEAQQSPIAIEAVERIAASCAIENGIRGRPSEARQKVRVEKARPSLETMHTWLEESLAKLSPKSVTTSPPQVALTGPNLRKSLIRLLAYHIAVNHQSVAMNSFTA